MSTSAASTSGAPTSTTSAPPAVPTNANSGGGGGGPQNSPLLFFVALGFGVVFTNLWIIVGVKYCFRYNARNRRGVQDENGEPIDLANMTQHRRRRREKKLMTIDEVNERFPITKYKTWVSTRAAQGLPTEGGVSQSRAASVRDAEGTIEPIGDSSKSVVTADVASTAEAHDPLPPSTPTTSSAPKEAVSPSAKTIETTTEKGVEDEIRPDTSRVENASSVMPASTATEDTRPAASTHSGDDDEDPIPAAIPGAAEMLEAPGDSCAICIDTLEEEEDVRGLSCGHAFHATCIDPWLTNRRACCPLCKADYYVPKPRPDQPQQPLQQEEGENGQQPSTTEQDEQIRRPSIAASLPAGGISRYMPRLTGRVDALPPERRAQRSRSRPGRSASTTDAIANAEQPSGSRLPSIFALGRRNNSTSQATGEVNPAPEPTSESSQQEQSRGRRWAPSLPSWRRGRSRENAASTDGLAANTTPGQLEAGRPATNTTTTNV